MSEESASHVLVEETVDRLLAELSTPPAVEQAELDRWSAPIWDALAASGFAWVGVPEAAGGSGGSLLDAVAVLRQIGRHAAPVPVAETGILAGWLLSEAGLEIPPGPATVVSDPAAVTMEGGRLAGTAIVAWGAAADRIVALVASGRDRVVVAVRPEQVEVTKGANLAGEPRDRVAFDLALADVEHAEAPAGVDAAALAARGVLTRVAMAAGALEAMSQMTIDYTNERHQFGKPVSTFQAVQGHLITVAQCAVRLSMASDLATRALARGDVGIEIPAAKVIADEVSVLGTRAAHQAHGAMGVTREYPLHHLSRRLWAWRHEYGSAAQWRRNLGAQVISAGPEQLFPLITS